MELCPVCKLKPLPSLRARVCSNQCRSQAWAQRAVAASRAAMSLSRMALPPGVEQELPSGPDQMAATYQILLLGHAPAGSRGYRMGTIYGRSQLLHWFPSSLLREVAMFRLEPFEVPAVPVQGVYVVQYMDAGFSPVGTPRFTIEIGQRDRLLRFCDGDRSVQPRARR